jgi:hypothetical protein
MKTFSRARIAYLAGVAGLSMVLVGCGGSQQDFVLTPATAPQQPLQIVAQAAADDADTALKIVPLDHLDPLTALRGISAQTVGQPTLMTTDQLETDYETIFGSLSQTLGVTLDTLEVRGNIDYIRLQPETGNFNLLAQPIKNNPFGIEAVSFRKVNYSTNVPLPGGNQAFQVSGALLMPEGLSAEDVQGVIVYFHGTTFAKNAVPSNPANGEMHLNAQVFASQGYIVAMPDYVGQGDDWASVHPYVLYPKVSAQTAVDMLSAIKGTIQEKLGPSALDTLPLFSAGYSEGGAYSLWFNAYIKENPGVLDPFYVLTHSVGMEGAYSTSQAIYPYLFDDVDVSGDNVYNAQSQVLVNIVKPLLSADAFLSYATYSLDSDYTNTFNSDFYAMQASPLIPQSLCNVNGVQLTIDQAFALEDTNISSEILSSALDKRGNQKQYPGLISILSSTSNSVDPLVSPSVLTSAFQQSLQQALRDADVNLSAVDDDGVSIITLDQDSVVTPNNYDMLLAAYPEKIRNAIVVKHDRLLATSPFSALAGEPVWQPIDHLGGPPFEFLYALHIFNQF